MKSILGKKNEKKKHVKKRNKSEQKKHMGNYNVLKKKIKKLNFQPIQ